DEENAPNEADTADDTESVGENGDTDETTASDGDTESAGNADSTDSGDSVDFGEMNLDDLISVDTVDSNRTVIEKEGGLPNETVAAKVFDEMNNGDIEIIETPDGEHYFIVLKIDILEDESYFEAARSSLLFEMKEEDYDSVIDGWTALQSVSRNEESYKRYDPKEMAERG
ncbi:MAG: hypothetical protein NC078_05645, partial [Ruminococcus sp.]|nr:hypothetical protein [Ruminococcus sp.]